MINPQLLQQPYLSIKQIREIDVPYNETTYLTLGGGIGSFVWADHLRVYGVPTSEIVALGLHEEPHAKYKRLCRNSQIPSEERLRSDSGSRPDNLWGWPGYGVSEIGSSVRSGRFGQAAGLAWQLFCELAMSESYTPRAEAVYESIGQEARRIGWQEMWRFGRIQAIRKTDDERYAVLALDQDQQPHIWVAPFLHIVLGYTGLRFLPDLQAYRRETRDVKHVVNAYESHEHVYETLASAGGVVMLRGRGIVASRILQKLYEVQQANPSVEIRVQHLMRSPRVENTVYERTSRLTEHHWQLQPFNFPKACFSGDYRVQFEQFSAEKRKELIGLWGGTTTADRQDWRDIVSGGLRSGWYEIRFGDVEKVKRIDSGKLETYINVNGNLDEKTQFVTDFIIDCTGLNADIAKNPVLGDLIEMYRLPCNLMGKLDVSAEFEITALRNGAGRAFAAGVLTLGGPFGPVDSFLGLQYAAHRSIEFLTKHQRPPHLKRLSMPRSAAQWMRWATGRQP